MTAMPKQLPEPTAADLTRLLRRKSRVEWLMLAFALLAFAWIPASLVLVFRDADLRLGSFILWQLWPLLVIPLCGFEACLLWRASLKRKIVKMELRLEHHEP